MHSLPHGHTLTPRPTALEVQFCTALFHSVSTSGTSIFLSRETGEPGAPYAVGLTVATGLTQNTGSAGYDWQGETPQFAGDDEVLGAFPLSVQELQSNGLYEFQSINITVVQRS